MLKTTSPTVMYKLEINIVTLVHAETILKQWLVIIFQLFGEVPGDQSNHPSFQRGCGQAWMNTLYYVNSIYEYSRMLPVNYAMQLQAQWFIIFTDINCAVCLETECYLLYVFCKCIFKCMKQCVTRYVK